MPRYLKEGNHPVNQIEMARKWERGKKVKEIAGPKYQS